MLFGMFDDASLWGDRVRLGASRIFDQNLGYQNSKCNFGIDSDAWRVHRAGIFFTDGRQRRFRRRNTGVQLRSQRFAGKAVAGRTNALLQRQQAGFKSQAGCTLRTAVVTPLVGSGLCLKPSNHPADVPAVSTGGACEPDVDRLLYRSGSWRGPSITARSAGADEEPTRDAGDAPVHVDEALRAAINRHQERWSAKRLQTAIFGLGRL
jgi:hypothetical protein